ncbi:putative divalent heavy-metal cations transporter [Candidatus Kinetoplastibacterium oncopeltii TCC290E]|uniref:Putative divalent heavy-metal cations transporter n=1 Tax=Candidatus Kinetoplastidibacterium stringomonadis TCC290E TaxID=1208920 RepID=M1LWF5_9PROT|nr:ZIP family metal transporter [Candidatus Kinetoplastibacterium oncopeltii]AGF48396.1 putative divalent heavy-metal cations transporter [Candidatus Kinetoplastibacterium oncopeltii TCC290E]
MIITYILVTTISSGLIAVCMANWLTYNVFSKYLHYMVSSSVGVFLSVSFLHLLPEAFNNLSEHSDNLLLAMLVSIVCFFILEKISLIRHNHHYEGDGHGHVHGHDRYDAGKGGVVILIGSSLHNFSDGVLIAASFIVSPSLGVLTALSIITHEVPHKLCDFVVLRNAGLDRRRIFCMILASSFCSSIGGLFGYFVLQHIEQITPYVLVVAASSFIYISISDLIPRMNEQEYPTEHIPQLVFVILGIFITYAITSFSHNHLGQCNCFVSI